MAGRTIIPSDRAWSKVGYCRALRTGDLIEVAGTSASGPGGTVLHVGDLYGQTKYVCDVILKAVQELGGDRGDIVRTRVFVTDISRWEEAGRAHYEAFKDHVPASAFYEVSALLHPELLIEIEATAIVGSAGPIEVLGAEQMPPTDAQD
jgi:enamine deaminase RidA (YjgF/YER057c/UK114 family)